MRRQERCVASHCAFVPARCYRRVSVWLLELQASLVGTPASNAYSSMNPGVGWAACCRLPTATSAQGRLSGCCAVNLLSLLICSAFMPLLLLQVCMETLARHNSPLIMSQCGSKGSAINIAQVRTRWPLSACFMSCGLAGCWLQRVIMPRLPQVVDIEYIGS